jgi:hypothetical protein
MLGSAFHDDFDFQQLFAFLYEDIMEFHNRAYKLIWKPGKEPIFQPSFCSLLTLLAWKIFLSAWSYFEHRFSALINSIKKTNNLIDQHVASLDILQAKQWLQKSLEDAVAKEKRWESEQLQGVMNWFDAMKNDQELKLEWLKDCCCPGTLYWIVQNPKFRSWM